MAGGEYEEGGEMMNNARELSIEFEEGFRACADSLHAEDVSEEALLRLIDHAWK